MRRIKILHTTRYDYNFEARFLPHRLHVRPREGHDIRIVSSVLEITPDCTVDWQRDLFNNSVAIVEFQSGGRVLEFFSELVVEHYAEETPLWQPVESARFHPFAYEPMERVSLQPYQQPAYPDDQARVADWLSGLWRRGQRVETVNLLDQVNQRIPREMEYTVRDEPGVQSPGETLALGRGSCRDFATLFIEALRYCGLGARFVSGYSAAGDTSQPSTTHAWSEVYLPGCGWVGFDSTSGTRVAGHHIAVAVHRHPQAVPPVSGDFVGPAGAKPLLSVAVQVSVEPA